MDTQSQTSNGANVPVRVDDKQLRREMAAMEPQFKLVLPPHIPPERFRRYAETAVLNNGELLKANRTTLWRALMQCAETGLPPDGKHSALVPYQGQVQFQPMVLGLLTLMRNSNEVREVIVDLICKNDEYDITRGSDPKILHRPNLEDRGAVIAAYCIVRTKEGGDYSEIMTRADLDKVRQCSQAWRFAESGPTARGGGKKNSPWHVWEGEMCIKSVVKRASKRAPTSNDRLHRAIDFDNEDYDPALAALPKPRTQMEQMRAKLTGMEPEQIESQDDGYDPASESQDANGAEVVDVMAEDSDAVFKSADEAVRDLQKSIAGHADVGPVREQLGLWKQMVEGSFDQTLAKNIIARGNAVALKKEQDIGKRR